MCALGKRGRGSEGVGASGRSVFEEQVRRVVSDWRGGRVTQDQRGGGVMDGGQETARVARQSSVGSPICPEEDLRSERLRELV